MTADSEQAPNYGAVTDSTEEKTLEEVYEVLGVGLAQYLVWGTLVLVLLSDMSELVVISILIPYLRCEWDLSVTFKIAISCSVFFFYALGGVLFGSISDKIGRRKVILFTTVCLLMANVMSAASPNKWVFLMTRVVVGLCIGANLPTTMVFASEIAACKYKEYGTFVLTFTASFAMMLVALIAYLCLNAIGWRWFIVLLSLPIVIALICLAIIPESPRFLVVSGKKEEAIATLKKFFKWNSLPYPENITIKTYQDEVRGNIADVLKPKYIRSTTLLSLMYFGNIFIIFGLIIFLPLALTTGFCGAVHKQGDTCKGLNQDNLMDLTIITSAACIGVVVGAVIAKKIGRNLPMKVCGAVVFFLTLLLYKCVASWVTNVILFAIKFFATAFNTLIWIVMPELYPTVIRNTATGFINFWGKFGGALSTGLVYVLYYISPLLVVTMFVAASVISLVAAAMWSVESRDAVFEEVMPEEEEEEEETQ